MITVGATGALKAHHVPLSSQPQLLGLKSSIKTNNKSSSDSSLFLGLRFKMVPWSYHWRKYNTFASTLRLYQIVCAVSKQMRSHYHSSGAKASRAHVCDVFANYDQITILPHVIHYDTKPGWLGKMAASVIASDLICFATKVVLRSQIKEKTVIYLFFLLLFISKFVIENQ